MIEGLGYRLKNRRIALHLSQKEVADAIAISPSIISNYENSERTPSLEILIALASLYRCSSDYLLGIKRENVRNIDASKLTEVQLQSLQQFLNEL